MSSEIMHVILIYYNSDVNARDGVTIPIGPIYPIRIVGIEILRSQVSIPIEIVGIDYKKKGG